MSRSRSENIQEALRRFDRDMQYRGGSRFDRLLIQRNILDRTRSTERSSRALEHSVTVVGTGVKDRYLPTEFRDDPQFSVHTQLAPAGDDIYSPSLFDPVAGVYQVRTEVTQHHAGILFQGCRLQWVLPSGWTFADGRGVFTDAEFISNPLIINRLANYSSGTAGWKVVVVEWYRS